MSDSIEDLARIYKKNVGDRHSRSIGLFTIPEYPEYESKRGMWSAALDAILTTLRYLAPATLLTLFWGQQSFLFKILKHIDSAFRAIVFSSEEQKQAVLVWLAEAGPVRIEHLETVWRHGWILCGVLDAALPGACAGHPPTRLSMKHAQAIADHYLGVEPVFSRQELESNDSLSKHQEWKLATYLDRIREALSKLTPPVSKSTSQRTSPETTQFTLDYVAKGSGLTAAQINNKMRFKIYPTSQQSLDPGEITILIRGPKDTYGMTVLPPLLGKAQLIRHKLLGLQSKQNYTENVLPITQGAAYLRSYGKNDMNKTYYIPKTKYDINISVETKPDHAKISYEVNLEGKHEIFITSRGQNIVGSPFMITASHNILGLLEKDSFCLEDGEEIDIVDVKNDRKVVLRIVDFVTEKMLLKENGSLEKISDEEANILMATDSTNKSVFKPSKTTESIIKEEKCTKEKSNKFNKAANNVIKMKRICKIMHDLVKQSQIEQSTTFMHSKSQQYIPDIVNSTFTDINTNPFIVNEKRNKYIVPESISVSLRTEKAKPFIEELSHPNIESNRSLASFESESNKITPDSLEKSNTSQEDMLEDDMSIDRMTPLSGNNPFLSDITEENFMKEKDLGTFVTSEYEANNLQNEEDSSIKIVIDPRCTPSISPNNPFIDEDVRNLVRPKSPVFRMLEESTSRDDSPYVDSKSELIPEEMLGNEFVNPFFTHHHHQPHEQLPIADFIIGAPVSLPPILRASSPEPDMRSLIIPRNEKSDGFKPKEHKQTREIKLAEASPHAHVTSAHKNFNSHKEYSKTENVSSMSPTFQSFESNLTEPIETSASSVSDCNYEPYRTESIEERNITPRKETWDSAYVSIDDNNSSPDNNNNENASMFETNNKHKVSPSEENFGFNQDELSNMGPAEREIWQTCSELNEIKLHEEIKPHKMEIKRPLFTPILEETDKIVSSGTKDFIEVEKDRESDPVTVAFAELNDMYTKYFPGSETESTIAAVEDNKLNSIEVDYTTEAKILSVDSASEKLSDVKGHEDQIEGTISEVQSNATEFVSASQTLPDEINQQSQKQNIYNKNETQFGDSNRSNIVLERKKYWDEKIRQIEAKSQETTFVSKKKRITAKQMKHDSLSKKKGKQMIKNFLNAGGYNQTKFSQPSEEKQAEIQNIESSIQSSLGKPPTEQAQCEEKLVEKWTKYWDNKVDKEHTEIEPTSTRAKTPSVLETDVSSQEKSPSKITVGTHNVQTVNSSNVIGINIENHNLDLSSTPVKQELPEEVFKAFETSPKRFFGTSRKQILNRIDSFTGRPSSSDESSPEVSEASYDSGLVSSRISLFHNLSHTEELSWTKRKSKSMHNIYQKKDNNKNVVVSEIKLSTPQENLDRGNIIENKIKLDIKDKINKQVLKQDTEGCLKEKAANTSNTTYSQIADNEANCQATSDQPNVSQSIFVANNDIIRRKSISKSEMDIFNKIPNDPADDYLDKYKSCDELPKINVKDFISLYESVSKTGIDSKPPKPVYRSSSVDSEKLLQTINKTRDAVKEHDAAEYRTVEDKRTLIYETNNKINSPKTSPKKHVSYTNLKTMCSIDKSEESLFIQITKNEDKETTYVSLSDIELEIVESNPEKSSESSPEPVTVAAHIEYKSRFKMAKQYFQSLEELREVRKPRKLNECEMLLKQSSESPEDERPRRKKKLKSHSMPSSEISKIWNELQENKQHENEPGCSKLVKISEKFNVDDLFTDVMEGKLSRQGSLRGIPHKKAVLEAFRSMENLADNQVTSYEIAETQLNDFAKENRIRNAQTYLSEYPYLPTTEPSKYQSRLDAKASGLISFKELTKRPRRNSVPDLRLNPKFEVDL